MSLRLYIAKSFVFFISFSKLRKFKKSLLNPELAQENVLKEILRLAGKDGLPEQVNQNLNNSDGYMFSEPALFYQTTSGSSGIKKQVPYNASLLKSFENMFVIWIADVLKNVNFKKAKLFLSISPTIQKEGLSSDAEYLNPVLKWFLNPFLAVPFEQFSATSGEQFLAKVAQALKSTHELEAISIWSPTYFLSLLDKMNIHDSAQAKNAWPNLKFISCWGDGSSIASFEILKSYFPDAIFQPKGLLCTEAPVTVPIVGIDGGVPLWTEVYFEYLNNENKLKPLSKIKMGEEGEIVLSTKGGLLRYGLGDIVRCNGFVNKSPTLKFLRRSGETSDLVGEKLDAAIVQSVLSKMVAGLWTLVPNKDHYVLICSNEISLEDLDQSLRKIFHYNLARELNQLKAPVVCHQKDFLITYNNYFQSRGLKAGDIKFKHLWSDSSFLYYCESLKENQPSPKDSAASNSISLNLLQ
jgi:hypothetical protein